MNKWKNIIIHHSASGWGNALFIDRWHKQRGWLSIGYHFIVLNGYTNSSDLKSGRRFNSLIGSVECGRTLDGDEWVQGEEIGAHALGLNADSIGICLIHNTGIYHPTMIHSLMFLVSGLMRRYDIPASNIFGHGEVDDKKPLCPGYDIDIIRTYLS